MKTGALRATLGKTIKGIVVKEAINPPMMTQIHIVFSDDTCIELYSNYHGSIASCNSLDFGGMEYARQYRSTSLKVIYEASLDENGKVVES